ncbi:sensor histidine kinase [Frigoribacterium sp. CFBP 13605]|uniref:sensor histidine kinase n=1 Tax=Frigoribacterium sp. CFBP 13605 TaxID=2774034 RepID=UPI001902DEC3|nr:histidine kinase [Frigoribacterium sp. CFBP 13605]MBD8141723.1 sensor histidine kinase [Frigoribacterium sp. CFBP 13605]
MTTTDGRRREPAYPRPRVPWWLGDTLAAVLVVGAAFAPFPVAGFRPTGGLAVAVVLAPVVLLPFRRRRPVPVLAAIVGLFGIAALLGTLAPGVVLATGIAVFAVAARTPRRRTIVVTVVTVLAVALLGLLGVGGRVVDLPVVQFTLLVAFAAAAGDASRSRREYIEAVTERAERAERTREAEASRRVAEERLRIARDLHDAVAHQISVISLNAGVASSAIETRPEKAVTALATIRRASRTVLGEIGDLLEVLRAGDSERVASPQPGLARLDELVAGFADAGLVVSTRVEGPLAAVTGAVDLVAYRVVQEGLTNAGKHGGENRAHVLVAVDEHEVSVVVTNPVPASRDVTEAADVRGGYGLLGLRERVASVRGVVETGPTPGGYRLAAVLPVTRGVDVAGSSGSAGSSGGSGGAS